MLFYLNRTTDWDVYFVLQGKRYSVLSRKRTGLAIVELLMEQMADIQYYDDHPIKVVMRRDFPHDLIYDLVIIAESEEENIKLILNYRYGLLIERLS